MVFCDLILACILYAQVLDHLRRFKGDRELTRYHGCFSLALRLFVKLGMTRFVSF